MNKNKNKNQIQRIYLIIKNIKFILQHQIPNQSMIDSQHIIEQLTRKVVLLDEYALTLQKQNFAKNNETQLLYNQLNQLSQQNDILRSHLTRINQENIQRIKKQQSAQQIEKKINSVNCSVDFDSNRGEQSHKVQQVNVCCQTQTVEQPKIDVSMLHQECTSQIEQLLSTISQKDSRIKEITSQSQHMYETIINLQEQNQSIKKQLTQAETKFKTQSKQLKTYQLQIEQLRNVLNEQRAAFQQERTNLQSQRYNNNAVEIEVQRLIKQNNRLIQRIRLLQKQKNNFYNQLRGRNVSPLKTSQISNRQNVSINSNMKPYFNGTPQNSQQKAQRFSSQFSIGQKKQKIKAERWKKIQEKINKVKQENEQIRANLSLI